MLKKLPPTLLVSLGLELLTTVLYIVWLQTHSIENNSVRINLAFEGASLVTYVFAIAGLLELARHTTGRESLGLRITAGGFGFGLALMAFWQVIVFVQPQWGSQTWELISRWGFFVGNALPLVGLIVATSQRHHKAALAGVAVLLVAVPLPPLAKLMFGWISGWRAAMTTQHSLHAIATVATLVLAGLLAGGNAARTPDMASAGLRTIASALWLRVIAAVSVAGLTLLLVLGKAGEGSAGILKLAMMSGAVINAVSLILLVRGAMAAAGSGLDDLPRWPLVASAAGTLWCLGVAIYQMPYTYRVLYGDHDRYGSSDTQDILQALSIAVPLVALGAVAVVATSIAGFAARRGLDQLRAEAQGKGAAFVGLMLANIAIQAWLLPKAESLGSFAMMTIGAMLFALWATVAMARLCTLAADSVHVEPPLPRATVV